MSELASIESYNKFLYFFLYMEYELQQTLTDKNVASVQLIMP